tara:strand:- start:398 stop:844 length:447 start_codon:yes stop_codon:yes gene_type:complete
MKNCSKCGIEKAESEFRVTHNQCRVCELEYRRKYSKTEAGRVYIRKKYNKPIKKIKNKLLKRLHNFLIRGSDTKLNRETMGCTRDELRAHYESLFKSGMTWENYGEWESDHIREMNTFDLLNEETWKECMHYSNLQPQWRTLNCRNIH